MNNDKQMLIDMLTRAGVEFEDMPRAATSRKPFGASGTSTVDYTSNVNVEAGYSGFVTGFFFGQAGELLYMGAWE